MRRTGMIIFVAAALLLGGCGGKGKPAAPAPPAEDPALKHVGEGCLLGSQREDIVKFPAKAGGTVTGYETGKGPVAVVMAHQADGDMCQWTPYAQYLATKGYRALAINFDVTPFGANVAAAIVHLRTKQDVKATFLLDDPMSAQIEQFIKDHAGASP